MERGAAQRGKLVMMSHMAPINNADNAGQNLVTAQTQLWKKDWEILCILTRGGRSEQDALRAVVPCHILQPSPRSLRSRVAGKLSAIFLRNFPGIPLPRLAAEIRDDPTSARAIAAADVVVLQWQREAGLAPVIRRLNPTCRIIGVLHDVDSQRASRKLDDAPTLRHKLKAFAQLAASRCAEWAILRWSDRVMVLSAKDAALLPHKWQEKILVVPPPIPVPESFTRNPEPGRVLFVGAPRPENEAALRWFLEEVTPHLREPLGSNLHVVGKQNESFLPYLERAGATVRGFVDDLDEEYASAAVVIVPLRHGAGVKFKTVEAILRRIPIVVTSIGAEGVHGLEKSARVTDTPGQFAERLDYFLSNPEAAREDADTLCDQAQTKHSYRAFSRAMTALTNQEL